MPRDILIEGYTAEELLQAPDEWIDQLIFCDEPIVFTAGTATILGEFRRTDNRITIELAQIDGGGEGVLPTLWVLAGRYAQQNGFEEIEWIVHAINCARPNMKLRRILSRLGFTIEDLPIIGKAYHLIVRIDADL